MYIYILEIQASLEQVKSWILSLLKHPDKLKSGLFKFFKRFFWKLGKFENFWFFLKAKFCGFDFLTEKKSKTGYENYGNRGTNELKRVKSGFEFRMRERER